jgi:hypothetical protein
VVISTLETVTAGLRATRAEKFLPREPVLRRNSVVIFFSQRRTTLLHCCLFLRIVDLRARKRAASISERRADGQEKGETGEEKGSEKRQEEVVSLAGLSPRAETSFSDFALHNRPGRFTAFRAVASLPPECPRSAALPPLAPLFWAIIKTDARPKCDLAAVVCSTERGALVNVDGSARFACPDSRRAPTGEAISQSRDGHGCG